MAYRLQKFVLQPGQRCMRIKLLDPSKSHSVCGAVAVPVANLTSVKKHGDEIVPSKPWPYKKRPYGSFWQFFDHTTKRFTDNSKVIVVDGNAAVGKSDFAKKIAEEFDMEFFPDPLDTTAFQTQSGFDVRELNEQLPPGAKALDIETFHMQKEHPDMLKTIGRTQLAIYRERFYNYINALEHLLNTGRGVVVERSPWSDAVFAETLRRHGYMTPQGLNFYYKWRNNSVCEMWKPHVVIYLDASIGEVRKRVNARNRHDEVKGKVVTDAYLQTIDDVYKNNILKKHSKDSVVMKYEITDMPDWSIIVEDLERLNLDTPCTKLHDQDLLFENWRWFHENDWNKYRMNLASKWQLDNLFRHPVAWDAPEMMISGGDFDDFLKIVDSHPEVCYAPGYNPHKNSVAFKL